MRKAVVRQSDGFIENVIEIEPDSTWQIPEGCSLMDAENGSPGDTWDGKKFVKPERIEPEPPRDLVAELDDLKGRIAKLEPEPQSP